MPYVYAFDHKHRRPPMDMKDLLGGKGANLAEMTSVLGLPVPPGFTITTDACRDYMAGGWPKGLDERDRPPAGPAREEDGPAPRRPGRPAAGERPVGRQVLDARDDGHRPQPRPQRPVGRRAGRADRGRALRLRLLPALHLDVRPHRARRPRRGVRGAVREGQGDGRASPPTPTIPAADLKELCQEYKAVVREHTGKPFPQDPTDAAARGDRGRVPLLERRPGHRLPGPRAHLPRPRHRGQRAGDGVRQPRRRLRAPASASPATRPPARTSPTATSSSTPRARTWWPASATPSRSSALKRPLPRDPRRAARHLRPARAPLPRHVRHRVHHRAGQALDAPDPGGQAHRGGRAADGRRHDEGQAASS